MRASKNVGFVLLALVFAISSLSAPSPAFLPSHSSSSNVASRFHPPQHLPSSTVDNGAAAAAEKATAIVGEWRTIGSADLYGNEVLEAVEQFQLDGTGSLYEVHSPQTELPRLGSPTS